MEFVTSANVNRLVWISSLLPDEEGFARRTIEDLEPHFRSIRLQFDHYTPANLAELAGILDHLAGTSVAGVAPVIHFDMHGSQARGLSLASSGEFMSWALLNSKLKAINLATKNNLCTVFATCFGFHMLKQLTFTDQSPCYLMIAPQEIVTLGFLDDHVADFYRDMFGGLNAVASYNKHLATNMRLFHSEKMLAVVLARYLYVSCIGKAGDVRKERLLTEVFDRGVRNVRRNRRALRKITQKVIRPDQGLINKYVDTFLMGKRVAFDIDKLMEFARQLPRNPTPMDFAV